MKPITRKEFIRACVQAYIRNNPHEYELFLEQMKERRAKLIDPRFAQLNNGGKIDEDNFRIAFSFPNKLYNALGLLQGDEYGKFGEKDNEMFWFAQEFPQFLLPEKL